MAKKILWSGFKQHRRPSQRSRRAVTAVEMALISPAFFLFLLGSTEITLIETAQALMENATYNVSRLAKTGYSTSTQSQSQLVSQLLVSELQSYGTMIDTTAVTLTDIAYNNFSGASSGSGGTSGYGQAQQIVVYTVSYPWKIFTPMLGTIIGTPDGQGHYIITLNSRMVVRNEPY